ncbi:hypothetical protein FRACA_1260008 [Frankia canadensis]|uniref:Uncharacterized protein n=1 Tax=Frankia canadensis TaxID=1836972 RepID=A0A2I2KKB8_9ACTN|nr:hypothetical protein FRACA_1260008 [Frankia canadensis]SOU53400.1 hypothetical protein FRACA_1260008 [Frankia canadensis]
MPPGPTGDLSPRASRAPRGLPPEVPHWCKSSESDTSGITPPGCHGHNATRAHRHTAQEDIARHGPSAPTPARPGDPARRPADRCRRGPYRLPPASLAAGATGADLPEWAAVHSSRPAASGGIGAADPLGRRNNRRRGEGDGQRNGTAR